MKNKAFLKLLKKTSPNSNSGFTLMELLVGLFMSIFVVGALGFGMLQVLRITQSETSKSSARNETSRAIDFISDEIRRAKTIENVATNATGFTTTGKTVVFALEIPEVTTNFGADNNASTTNSERIVYYLQSASGTAWRGDQVLYRYGPPLGTNGDYTTGAWGYEALIDNISSNTVTSECATGTTTTPASPTGFYACITGTNTAQLYFSGLTKTVTGSNTDNYAASTQAVARVTDAPANAVNAFSSYTWSVQDLGGAYNCSGTTEWTIRTDFDNTVTSKPWIRNTNRQPQPISIDSSKPLTITTSPIGNTGCNSKGNDYLIVPGSIDPVTGVGTDTTTPTSATGKQGSTWESLDQYDVKVSHKIDFSNPKTFNGDEDGGTYNTSSVVITAPDGTETNSPQVRFLKKGTDIPHYGVFDSNNDGDLNDPGDQKSLGQFLYDKGYARLTSGTLNTPDARFEMISSIATTDASYPSNPKVLGDDQRIISFEVGQTDTANPGFDLQDNIFIVTSDVFKKKFPSTCFSTGCPTP